MNVVGRVSSLITQGMSSVATPFHPFGGAVDIIMVKQHDGTYKSTPWYVRFGKFQGVLKGAEKVVCIEVNGVEANFHMYLDNSGEAYFVREADPGKGDDEDSKDKDNHEVRTEDNSTEYSNIDDELTADALNDDEVEVRDERSTIGMDRLERVESDGHIFYEFQDDESFMDDSLDFPEYDSSRYESLDNAQHAFESQDSTAVVLVSVDGHILTAPLNSSERNSEDVQPSPGEGIEECKKEEDISKSDNLNDLDASGFRANPEDICETNSGPLPSEHQLETEPETLESTDKDKEVSVDSTSESKSNSLKSDEVESNGLKRDEVFQSCLELSELALQSKTGDQETVVSSVQSLEASEYPQEVSQDRLTNGETEKGNNEILRPDNEVSSPHDSGPKVEEGNDDLGLDQAHKQHDTAPVTEDTPQQKEDGSEMSSTQSGRWGLWPLRFRRGNTLEMSNSSNEEIFVDSLSVSFRKTVVTTPTARAVTDSPRKQILRTNVPTADQIASLNLKEGQNTVNFVFSTKVFGSQKVEAHIYLWKWNTRIVISDVDGTITKSDVLGQVMPLVGKDWTHTGIARLLSAIKENGYQLLYLSARAIVQAYLTKNFLFNVRQDGKSIPDGPVVISPDGLFPSLYREVIRRAPHEFKIACLEDIKALFPPDYNPFYAGFGNRDTDELSYRKMGIPKGKIFIINPKGEVAINHRIDVKSYTSLHTLVDDMFPPPTSMDEQEDFNSWNYWKMPLPEVDDL